MVLTISDQTIQLATEVIDCLRKKKLKLVTAESCTGGLIAATLSHIPGSSDILYGGFVTYANEAKIAQIGVPAKILEAHGAVSQLVANEMAKGALKATNGEAQIAVSVTGIAGPSGGSDEKPVGLVYFSCQTADRVYDFKSLFSSNNDRSTIREQAVTQALNMVLQAGGQYGAR